VEDREFLERIDGSLVRIDRHMERGNELMEHNTEAFERNAEAFERSRQTHEDLRRFIREISVRNERVAQSQVGALAGVGNTLGEMTGALHDMRKDIRAHTEAIFRMLDRLD
jgi:methyl-accepting chemotaxis protein